MPDLIPQSNALLEASPLSLSDLLSKDPEGFSRRDRDQVVRALREQRAKWEASEVEARNAPKATKLSDRTLKATVNSDDMGL